MPLVVPEVNPEDVAWHNGVIANPNCSTIQMVVALKPLYDIAPIKRVVVSTYQAASGAGAAAMDELYEQTREFLEGKDLTVDAFAHQIAFNVIPHIDVFMEDASTKEEWKMVVETKKIMHDDSLAVSATCVRVPVLRCHGESINVEFKSAITPEQAREALEQAPNVIVMDDTDNKLYPMPGLLAGTNDTFIGRLRQGPVGRERLGVLGGSGSDPQGRSAQCGADRSTAASVTASAGHRSFKREGALPSRFFLFARKRNHYNSQVRFLYAELLVSMGATKRKEQP